MSMRLPIYSIAAGADFLKTLADAVLKRFPVHAPERPLSDWTILLPTRRAARAFGEILQRQSGLKAMVMPRIKPIGDLDEDRLLDGMVASDLPPAMSKASTLVILQDLVRGWASHHAAIDFAKDILASPAQALNLAKSLSEFITTIETQECDFGKLPALYNSELAEHRDAIISLLQLSTVTLREEQAARHTMGAAARRSAIIRMEAKRIQNSHPAGPIIAAGSTGTIPATRELLAAIARHEEGAVILPGLDLEMDLLSWAVLKEEHPQFALQQLLASLGVAPHQVEPLGPVSSQRGFLLSEMMRPSETAERWHETLPVEKVKLARSLTGITEIAAPDRHAEARTIAVILRQVLETSGRNAVLVTPNRDLAKRVISELARWNIAIADSAGLSLGQFKLGSAFDLLLQAVHDGFTPDSAFALLRHADVQENIQGNVLEKFEFAVLRGLTLSGSTYEDLAHQASALYAVDHHPHPLVKALTEEDWQNIFNLGQTLDVLIKGFNAARSAPLAEHVKHFETALRGLTSPDVWNDAANANFLDFLDELTSETQLSNPMPMQDAALLLRELLRSTTVHLDASNHPRLAILGTLEARLIPADLVILGGLNEASWPAQPDPGPWLNRKMRNELNMPQPERDIGMAAHDFEQGLAHPEVILTWSKRINHAPASPSRWLLRLANIRAAAGIEVDNIRGNEWLALAALLKTPNGAEPMGEPISKPAFAPPLTSRPRRFSATEVEKLIRNPYAIYARKILKLEPLAVFGFAPDASDRGTLFHEALRIWNKQIDRAEKALLAAGEKAFLALNANAEARNFWWPHFRRVAAWLAEQEIIFEKDLSGIKTESTGRHEFKIDGDDYILTARADRIDILENGAVRLIDYKTGSLPSVEQVQTGLSPQMTLESALLLEGAFAPLSPKSIAQALYIQIGRSRGSMKVRPAAGDKIVDFSELAREHLFRFKTLLHIYRGKDVPYLPRLIPNKDDSETDFDHLSRYLEWELSTQKSKGQA